MLRIHICFKTFLTTMPDTEMASVDETDEAILVQREDSGAGGGERQIHIHPLVIVNITDHRTRQKCNSQLSQTEAPQVIGALFGIQKGLDVAVYDSFEMKYDVVSGEMQIDKEFLTSRIQQCACSPEEGIEIHVYICSHF